MGGGGGGGGIRTALATRETVARTITKLRRSPGRPAVMWCTKRNKTARKGAYSDVFPWARDMAVTSTTESCPRAAFCVRTAPNVDACITRCA